MKRVIPDGRSGASERSARSGGEPKSAGGGEPEQGGDGGLPIEQTWCCCGGGARGRACWWGEEVASTGSQVRGAG
jgi:hypothetical protein